MSSKTATQNPPARTVIGPLATAVISIAAMFFLGCSEDMGASFFKGKGESGSDQKFFIPLDEDIIEDKETGLKMAENVITIHFSPNLDEASIKKIISSVNGETVGYDKSVNLYQVRFPGKSFEEVENIRMKLLAEYKEVESASMLAVSVHKNPYNVK